MDVPVAVSQGLRVLVLDARAYMLRLSKDRERSALVAVQAFSLNRGELRARWQRAAQLLLAKADVGAISRQLELALLYDGILSVVSFELGLNRAGHTFRYTQG
jgi:hypothetical protein